MVINFFRKLKRKIYGQLLPTDKEIFEFVYDNYYNEFTNFDKEKNKTRITKNFIPIDIEMISKHFGVDEDIIFTRFYYVFKERYDYSKEFNGDVHFFKKSFGECEEEETELNVVHFPYLISILSEMRYKEEKFHITTIISILALFIAFISIFISSGVW